VTTDPVDQLSELLDLTAELVAGLGDRQWAAATPCSEWSVADLVGHLTAGSNLFTAALGGEPPAGPGSPQPGSELVRAYQDAAGALLAAFRQPGVMDKLVTVPFGSVPGSVALHLRLTELLAHGWDLARATGQPAAFPADLAEQEIAFCHATLGKIPPGRSPFGPSRPVPPDAPAADRLAALLGRDVTFTAAQRSGGPGPGMQR